MKKTDREIVYNKYGGKCAYCGCTLEKGWHNNLIWTFSSQHKPENDTLECLFHEYSEDVFLDKWTKGYIVLIDGYIKNKHTAWAIEYAPMALGFFDNTFLYEDKHIVKNKVLQLALYK